MAKALVVRTLEFFILFVCGFPKVTYEKFFNLTSIAPDFDSIKVKIKIKFRNAFI